MIAATKLRRKISNQVLYLRDLPKHIDSLLNDGFSQELITDYLAHKMIKDPKPTSKDTIVKDINLLFNLGGVISGGATL